MIIRVPLPSNTRVALQRCGYAAQVDRRTGAESFTRRLGGGLYPRFHCYLDERPDGLTLKLHLDQKQPSYPSAGPRAGGWHAHSGEYDGPTIEAEGHRLQSLLTAEIE